MPLFMDVHKNAKGTTIDDVAAAPGQIFTSNVVRELSAGKRLRFDARGEKMLKGFADSVPMYEVAWPPV